MKSSNSVISCLPVIAGTATALIMGGYYLDNSKCFTTPSEVFSEEYGSSLYRMKLMHENLMHIDYDETDIVVPIHVTGKIRISLKKTAPLQIV
jgi:hypothetical protein